MCNNEMQFVEMLNLNSDDVAESVEKQVKDELIGYLLVSNHEYGCFTKKLIHFEYREDYNELFVH